MSDLAATFDAHVQAEFQDLDLEATMDIYRDQATVLVQAEALLDRDTPENGLLGAGT